MDSGACHIWLPSTVRTPARPLRVEVCVPFKHRTMRTTLHVATWPNVSLHTHSLSWMPCRTSSCRGRAQSRTMGFGTGSVLLPVTHTGAVERITGTSATITRNWPKEGVHDVGCCGCIASRYKHPIFLVRGSCRARCRWRDRFSMHF